MSMIKRRMSWPMALCAAGVISIGAAGCGIGSSASSDDSSPSASATIAAPTSLVNAGKLTYGVAATFAPYEYQDGTTLTGFDVDMAQKLASEMGLEANPMDMDFSGLITALQGSRVDIVNSAMYINDDRSSQVDFVPYMKVGEAMIVQAGNDVGIHDIPDDLSGKTIAVTQGAIGETYMNQFNDQLKSEGKDEINVMALPSNEDALTAVSSGRADGFDSSTAGAAYTTSQQPDKFEVAATFNLGTQIGIAVRKGDDDTKQAIENALNAMVADGTYAQLMEKYNLPDDASLFN